MLANTLTLMNSSHNLNLNAIYCHIVFILFLTLIRFHLLQSFCISFKPIFRKQWNTDDISKIYFSTTIKNVTFSIYTSNYSTYRKWILLFTIMYNKISLTHTFVWNWISCAFVGLARFFSPSRIHSKITWQHAAETVHCTHLHKCIHEYANTLYFKIIKASANALTACFHNVEHFMHQLFACLFAWLN